MKVEECYAMMNGDYNDVISRLISDERVSKYIVKFLDNNDYDNIFSGLDAKDYMLAFRSAHSVKGMCLNLGFPALASSSSEVCEVLRPGDHAPEVDMTPLLDKMSKDYDVVKQAIEAFRDSQQ